MTRNSFGLLISQVDGAPFGTHLPLLLDRSDGPYGTLIGHVARANPHSAELECQTALAIFSGPHTYISPTWYEAEKVVPTWNYVAVHAYGKAQLMHDPAELRQALQALVGTYEQGMPEPWTFDDNSPFAERLVDQIVGFRIRIEKLEGKWKLNQNHPAERRRKVIAALRSQQGEDAAEIASLMEQSLTSPEPPESS